MCTTSGAARRLIAGVFHQSIPNKVTADSRKNVVFTGIIYPVVTCSCHLVKIF